MATESLGKLKKKLRETEAKVRTLTDEQERFRAAAHNHLLQVQIGLMCGDAPPLEFLSQHTRMWQCQEREVCGQSWLQNAGTPAAFCPYCGSLRVVKFVRPHFDSEWFEQQKADQGNPGEQSGAGDENPVGRGPDGLRQGARPPHIGQPPRRR